MCAAHSPSANWREPTFNLFLTSSGAELLNNDHGKIRVDAGLALSGPFRSAYLSGAATVTQGVVYAPEPTGRHVIGAGDPALFNVLDTAIVSDRELFPPQSPLLANMRMDDAVEHPSQHLGAQSRGEHRGLYRRPGADSRRGRRRSR